MNEPPKSAEAEAQRWFGFAGEDLELAAAIVEDQRFAYRIAGFHAQQAAEKALKAVLVRSGIPVPRVHNLVTLASVFVTLRERVLAAVETTLKSFNGDDQTI